MTEKEIIEGNKLIALFDGFEFLNDNSEFCPNGYFVMNSEEGHNNMHHPEELNYHKSYDWLMPVVEKIESLGYGISIERKLCAIYNLPHIGGVIVDLKYQESKIKAVYNAVINFIVFYNQQSK